MTAIPRVVVGGVASGVGKTTAVVAIAHALARRGLRVAAFKAGPDYLDPTYHQRVTGAACHNLDGWMMGRTAVRDTFARATEHADIALIEGVMGLFDGASPVSDAGSTAEIARWLDAPVVLVVDAGGMARSIAPLVRGFAQFDPELRVGAIIANRVGSRGHLDILRRALAEPPVLGGLPKAAHLAFPSRHLGLRTADGAVAEDLFAEWGARAEEWLDLDRLVALAEDAPALPAASAAPGPAEPRCRIGVARDEAFHFYYEHNLRALELAGAELVPFSPVRDPAVPDVDALYLGGGYPEVAASQLADNRDMRAAIAAFCRHRPVYAECGGLMYLCRELVGVDGQRFPMAGVFDATAVLHDRLQALGYVEVETQADSPLGPGGVRFRGHQFRYSSIDDMPLDVERLYTVRRRRGGGTAPEGYRVGNAIASYVHAHFASNRLIARHLVGAACESHGHGR